MVRAGWRGNKYEFLLYLKLSLSAAEVFRRARSSFKRLCRHYQSARDKKEHEASTA